MQILQNTYVWFLMDVSYSPYMLRYDSSKQTVVVKVAINPWSMLLNLLIHVLFVENSMDGGCHAT